MPDAIHTLVGNPSPGIEGNKRAYRRSKPPVPSNGSYRIEYGSLLRAALAAAAAPRALSPPRLKRRC